MRHRMHILWYITIISCRYNSLLILQYCLCHGCRIRFSRQKNLPQRAGRNDRPVQVNIVIQMTAPLVVNTMTHSPTDIANKFTFRHFILNVWTRQIDGQHDERKADDVHSI